MTAWNLFDRGRDLMEQVLAPLDPPTRAAVDADLETLRSNPDGHGLPSFEWRGDIEWSWPTEGAILGGRVGVQYIRIAGYTEPAIVAAVDLNYYFAPPNGQP